MTRILRFCAVLIVGIAAPALAQVQTGSILVRATDEQGAVVPGVTVSVSSPVLPQEIVGATDSSGVYRVPGLTIGTYSVKTALQGFQTVIREGVIVLQSQTVSIDLSMRVSKLSETVTVTGESPVVDTKTVGSAVNIDKNLLEKTPGGKDIWSLLEYKAPGIVIDTSATSPPDVGGNQGGLQRSMSARGTPNAQNTQLLNGVNVNDPAAQGFSMNYYIPTEFENVEVATGAQDISVGTGGILINMVTKAGSNSFNGLALQTYQGKSTQWDNIDTTLSNAGFRPNANATNLITNSNFQAGGPLVRNKLFYFGSVNYQATHVFIPNFPAVSPSFLPTALPLANQDTTDIVAGDGKITYQLNGANRFEGYVSKQRYDKPNRGASAGNTQDSDNKELDTFVISQLSWNRVLSSRMFLDSKVSYNNTHFPLFQKTDAQSISDNSTGIVYRNLSNTAIMYRRRMQVVSNWQYYLPTFLGGRHEFKAGFDNGYTPESVDTIRAGDVNLVFNSLPTPKASTVTIFSSPVHRDRAVMSTAFYGQDSYSIKRLTITGGVRWERIEGYLPAQVTPASQYFPEGLVFKGVSINGVTQDFTVQKSFSEVRGDPLWHNWGPRIAGTFDLDGRGTTVLKASFGRYLDQINTGTPPNPNALINQVYGWNDQNGDWNFQPGGATWDGQKYVGGEFGALQSTNNLAVAVFDKTLRRPYRNEGSISLDRELFPNFLLTVAFLHTREHDVQGTVDQNIDAWGSLFTPVTLTDPGRDGIAGTADDVPITVYNQNQAGAVTSPKTINDDRLATRYNGLDIVADKRFSKGWTALAGYTYSHTEVDLLSLANPNAAFVNAAGESSGRRHNFKASGSYELPFNVLFGAQFRLQSGLPITRTWAIPAALLRQGAVTVNAEPRGSVELPWLPTLDIRGGRFFRLGGNRIELSVDCYNITNASTVFAVRTTTGTTPIRVNGDPNAPTTSITSFMSPTGVLAPRVIRFNLEWRFGGSRGVSPTKIGSGIS